ncbi:hypothetical protein V494_01322 [Pseudogymnoascus sp. VKM F-4513 (FW-928)]|nr:hypothetical protein V494_01322 [Pseudogymnoascus sp. VKM F-4513 (FW-928)]
MTAGDHQPRRRQPPLQYIVHDAVADIHKERSAADPPSEQMAQLAGELQPVVAPDGPSYYIADRNDKGTNQPN